jgi:multiple antibiotic resistance protein
MLSDYVSSALVTLLVTLDPPALAPIFISLTRGMTGEERRRLWVAAALAVAALLCLVGFLATT